MTLGEQMAEDVSAVFLNADEFAEEIAYTPRGGLDVTILAVVDRNESFAPQVVADDPWRVRRITVTVAVADVPTVTEYRHAGDGDTFTIDERTWHVVGESSSDVGMRVLQLESSDRIEASGEEYRR